MAPKINLLPTDLGPGGETVRIARVLNKSAMYTGALFLFLGLLGVVYILFQSNQIRLANDRIDGIKKNIETLQSTEQKLFLVKDRIQKAKIVYSDKNAQDLIAKLGAALSNLPTDVTIDEADVDPSSAKFAIVSKSSLGMASFLNTFTATSGFKQIVLKGFTFTPGNGYKLNLEAF